MLKFLSSLLFLIIVQGAFAAVECDGSADFIDTNYGPAWTGASDDFTIAFWFKVSSTPFTTEERMLGTLAETGANDARVFVAIDGDGNNCAGGDEIYVKIRDSASGATDLCSGWNVSDTSWHHVAYTYSESGNQIIYVDGVQKVSSASDKDGNKDFSSTAFYVCAINNKGTASDFFTGKIDDVRIYERELSASEIEILYKSKRKRIGISLDDSNFKVHYELDHESIGATLGAGDAIDSSRSGNNGDGTGTSLLFTDGPINR